MVLAAPHTITSFLPALLTQLIPWFIIVRLTTAPNATQPPIQVRLVDGADEHEGRVEILYAGLWGTICGGFGFDLAAANIICRQLGYPSALRVAQEFGSGTGQIWLTYLFCTGNETSLEQCFHSQFGTGSCYFGVEARIECRGKLII